MTGRMEGRGQDNCRPDVRWVGVSLGTRYDPDDYLASFYVFLMTNTVLLSIINKAVLPSIVVLVPCVW